MSSQPLPTAETRSPHRRISVTVGCLFFFQLFTFLIGSSLVQQYLEGDSSRQTLTVGVALEMCAGLAVVAIGLLMYQVLKVVHRQLALAYPAMRITEFAVSALLSVYLVTHLEAVPNRLLWVYIPTGIGGLILNYLFFVSTMIPRPISVLGLIGYSLLLLTVPLDLLGVVDVERGAGLAMQVPGGLYEFVVLPLWLITRGFRPPVADVPRSPAAQPAALAT